MKALRLFLLAGAVVFSAGCSHDEYVYHHTTRTYTPHHHYDSGSGSSLPGQATHLAAPGAPDTFRAVGGER